jgi:hypothetical protein
MNLLVYIAGIFFIAFIVVGIYLYRMFTEEKQDPENLPFLINGMSAYSNGYGLGSIEKMEFMEKLVKIVFYPRDLNYLKLSKEEKTLLKPQTIFVLKRNVIPLGFSARRNDYLVLPDRIENLSEKLKNHPFGKYVMAYLKESEENQEEVELLRKRAINQNKIAQKVIGLDLFEDYISKSKEITKDVQPPIRIEKSEKKEE